MERQLYLSFTLCDTPTPLANPPTPVPETLLQLPGSSCFIVKNAGCTHRKWALGFPLRFLLLSCAAERGMCPEWCWEGVATHTCAHTHIELFASNQEGTPDDLWTKMHTHTSDWPVLQTLRASGEATRHGEPPQPPIPKLKGWKCCIHIIKYLNVTHLIHLASKSWGCFTTFKCTNRKGTEN